MPSEDVHRRRDHLETLTLMLISNIGPSLLVPSVRFLTVKPAWSRFPRSVICASVGRTRPNAGQNSEVSLERTESLAVVNFHTLTGHEPLKPPSIRIIGGHGGAFADKSPGG